MAHAQIAMRATSWPKATASLLHPKIHFARQLYQQDVVSAIKATFWRIIRVFLWMHFARRPTAKESVWLAIVDIVWGQECALLLKVIPTASDTHKMEPASPVQTSTISEVDYARESVLSAKPTMSSMVAVSPVILDIIWLVEHAGQATIQILIPTAIWEASTDHVCNVVAATIYPQMVTANHWILSAKPSTKQTEPAYPATKDT